MHQRMKPLISLFGLALLSLGACSSSKHAARNGLGGQGGSFAGGAGVAASGTPDAGINAAASGAGGSLGTAGTLGAAGVGGIDAGGTGAAGAAGAAGQGGAGGAGGTGTDAGAAGTADSGTRMLKKFVGNITTQGQVRSDFDMYWDQITPENEGKWGSVEGTRNQMNWSGLDRVHDYAVAHGIVFKQHNFVWGAQQPGWLAGLSAADQKAEVEEWIRLFCERYPDVALIDVVNEPPPHTMPVYMNALGGAGASGYDWIVQAFKWSRQYCPHAILILNDYNNIEYGNDNSHFIDIVTKIKNAGAPIDAIGAQAHAAHSIADSTVKGYLDKLAATGLPIYITEYDIDLASDSAQQQVMQSQMTMFWNDNDIKGITLWGYIVGATWQTNSGLMTSTSTKRPAMSWLMTFLGR